MKKKIFFILFICLSILSIKAQKIFTETDSYYQKGEQYKVIKNECITLIANLSQIKQYGKYYKISLIIENASDYRFDFDPLSITGKYIINKKKEVCENDALVLSYEDYARKARKRINTASVFAGIGVGLQSFSTAPTSTVTYSDNMEYVSSVNVYDSYEKNRQIQDSMERLSDAEYQSYEIIESMKENYLLRETMFPNTSLAGYMYIKYKSCDAIDVRISLNGEIYKFIWTFNEGEDNRNNSEIDDLYYFK